MKNRVFLAALLSLLSAKPVMAIESNTVSSQPQKTEQVASEKQRVGSALIAAGLGAVALAAGYHGCMIHRMMEHRKQPCPEDPSTLNWIPKMIREVTPELVAFTPEYLQTYNEVHRPYSSGYFYSFSNIVTKQDIVFKMDEHNRFWVGVLMGDMKRLGININRGEVPFEMYQHFSYDCTLLPQYEQLIRESAAIPDQKVADLLTQWAEKGAAAVK